MAKRNWQYGIKYSVQGEITSLELIYMEPLITK